MRHERMNMEATAMSIGLLDNPVVKSIGTSGQISLGKEYAGRQVLIEKPAEGVWIIRTASIIPDNETWLHNPATQQRLKSAIAWAKKNPARASSPDQLPVARIHAPKRKARST